ncbi:MAG: peptide/nickel transport system substrate-binding protein [Sphingomonadales bacterium]|jgi:peptide/nickel transport system substrate-binding protein|nr:peptide/nickel transport system substrate-binding protein [Sphingomonadales bacterium]
MTRFRPLLRAALAAALLGLAGCGAPESGPIEVSAIGGPPRLANPNLELLDPPSAFLVGAVAQGLVQFNAAGEIEPALAQSWIISDDGLRYTFRLRRASWANGGRVTAYQVAARLRAALGRASRNKLKPVLGAIAAIEPMTDEVLEISLRGPRPFFLQLLAHPELAILQQGVGTGPYRLAADGAGGVRLQRPRTEDDPGEGAPEILLRGERAALAIARFADGQRVLVVGGTIGDLPLARAADLPAGAFVFDPVSGLFGLAFTAREGPLADPAVRRALAMAVDRQVLAAAMDAPGLAQRTGLMSPGVQELPNVTLPDWAALPQEERRAEAARAIAALGLEAPLRLRVAMPDGPGYRLIFAYLRHDWRLIGVDAVRVGPGQPADLVFIDEVAPANLASWYLRHFTCEASMVCDPAADAALLAARLAARPADRQAQFAIADRILTGLTPFIPLTQPVRWSLVPRRLTGFRPNPFARHPAVNLIAERD